MPVLLRPDIWCTVCLTSQALSFTAHVQYCSTRCVAGLQEIKLQAKHEDEVADSLGLDDWSLHWNCSQDKAGYSGVAMFYRKAAFPEELNVSNGIGLPTHDGEGRVITLELPDMFVVNAYVPNSGETLFLLKVPCLQFCALHRLCADLVRTCSTLSSENPLYMRPRLER